MEPDTLAPAESSSQSGPEEVRATYPSIGQAVGATIGMAFLSICLYVPVAIAKRYSDLAQQPLLEVAVLVLVAGIYLRKGMVRNGRRFSEQFPFASAPLRPYAAVGLLVLGGGQLLDQATHAVLAYFPRLLQFDREFTAELMPDRHLVQAFIVVVLVYPFIEELLFRGLFLRGFLANHGPRKALVVSALLWAMLHMPWHAPSIFVIGLGLGWLVMRTGSLTLAVYAHVLNNALFALIYCSGLQEASLQSVWVTFGSVLASGLGFHLVRTTFSGQKLPEASSAAA